MAEIAESGGGHGKGGKKRAKKQSTRVDMTPMVDLAFLLLTFFVLTSTFSKPKSMEITFPVPPPINEKPVEVKNGLSIILTKDHRAFYYKGQFLHCGVDSWQLVRLNGVWKIQYLIDTRRKEPCQ